MPGQAHLIETHLNSRQLLRSYFFDSLSRACNKEQPPKHCSQCHSVYYCDVSCQRAHWKEHKLTCTPPTQSTSPPANEKEEGRTILVPIVDPAAENKFHFDVIGAKAGQVTDLTKLPGNVHGEKRFLVKVHNAADSEDILLSRGDRCHPALYRKDLRIYDEPRQLDVIVNPKTLPDVSQAIVPVIMKHGCSRPGGGQSKVFMWARRVGPNIKLDLDELPSRCTLVSSLNSVSPDLGYSNNEQGAPSR